MGRLKVNMNITLDGVLQASARQDEDVRDGFSRGGWAVPYYDPEASGQAAQEGAAGPSALLFGRRTYLDFYSVWPNRTDNPFTDILNRMHKYVASTTLEAPLPWENSTLLSGDAMSAVKKLKDESAQDLVVLGCGELVQSLMYNGLVDEYTLSIHPLVLGEGRRLFRDGAPYTRFTLVDTKTTRTGVIIATYRTEAMAAGT